MKIKYPKFTLLVLTFLAAYIVLASNDLVFIREIIAGSGLLGAFIAGSMFTYGFTSAPATAAFLIMSKSHNLVITALIGGIGSLFGDMVIFKLIRGSFSDEVKKLAHEKIIKEANHAMPKKIKRYFTPVLAGLIIASPFPDEVGVCMMASDKWISQKKFAAISYIFNTIGILALLYVGSLA
jgi:hypothetical protein